MRNQNYGIGLRGAVMILVLLAAGIGITGILRRQSVKQIQEVSMQEPVSETEAVGTQALESPAEISPAILQDPAALPAMAPAEFPEMPQSLKTAAPVPGSTITPYAMEALSYNETTRDWRVHNGIDLAADPGSPVCAAADGTVYTTYEDDTLGYTVVIRHEGGYTTRYSSLDSELCVAAGDRVTLGQTIGYAGDSALVETVMGPHVHFSVSCQDIPMDPMDFLALG